MCWVGFGRSRGSAVGVDRKARHRKLRATRGSSTMARRKSSCAGRSSALNRRSRSHIRRKNLEQTAIHEPAQKFRQVGAKQFRFDIEFGEKLLVSHVNVRRTRHKLPHPRAGLVQSEVLLRFEIQKDGLPIQKAAQNLGRRGGSVRKRNHRHNSSRGAPDLQFHHPPEDSPLQSILPVIPPVPYLPTTTTCF